MNFHSEGPIRENGTTFSEFPFVPGIFQWDEPKETFTIYIPTVSSGNLLLMVNNACFIPDNNNNNNNNGIYIALIRRCSKRLLILAHD